MRKPYYALRKIPGFWRGGFYFAIQGFTLLQINEIDDFCQGVMLTLLRLPR